MFWYQHLIFFIVLVNNSLSLEARHDNEDVQTITKSPKTKLLKTCGLPQTSGIEALFFPPKAEQNTCHQIIKIGNPIDCKEAFEDNISTMSQPHTALAVVLYDESKLMPHEKPSRTFQIGTEEFVIPQDWTGQGVAGVVWDSAVVLAEYITKHPEIVKGKSVLELGAGTGLAGLAAASLGSKVTVTEREEAMDHLISTVERNTEGKHWDISAQVLDWTVSYDDSDKFHDFDVVIGADIIYIEETFEYLLKTLKSFASKPEILVLLSCRIRYDRDEHFLNMLKELFEIKQIFYEEDRKIKIYSATRIR